MSLWLPKDERKLLAYYYRKVAAGQNRPFLRSELETIWQGDDVWERVKIATVRFKRLNLVASNSEYSHGGGITVGLSPEGRDLGRKYNSKVGTLWVWGAEYNVWVILGFITTLTILLVTTSTLLVTIFKD